jgi:crotonobetainyl-CoA:carnitine CoA-transferase CaiB-like acyl-CoA transferase
VAEVAHPEKGNVRELHVLLRVSDAEQVPHRLAPELGEHTDELLAQLGCDEEEITQLRTAGAVR